MIKTLFPATVKPTYTSAQRCWDKLKWVAEETHVPTFEWLPVSNGMERWFIGLINVYLKLYLLYTYQYQYWVPITFTFKIDFIMLQSAIG